MFDEGNENLPYLSSPHPFGGRQKTTNPDEPDLGTLIRVSELLEAQISSYLTIDSLTTSNTEFDVAQQLAVNKRVVGHLRELQLLVQTAIEEVKEA